MWHIVLHDYSEASQVKINYDLHQITLHCILTMPPTKVQPKNHSYCSMVPALCYNFEQELYVVQTIMHVACVL